MALKSYKKNLDYSYTLGVYPTLELLQSRPDLTKTVLLKSDNNGELPINKIKALCDAHQIGYDVSPKAIKKISVKENTYAVGVFKKDYPVLSSGTNHLVLVHPSNMGNLGTIVRTMIGFGVTDLALIRPAADIFDPKVVRSSMGALFAVDFRFCYFDTFTEYHDTFKNSEGKREFYFFTPIGESELSQTRFEAPYSMVFGNEGKGLDLKNLPKGKSVHIKQSSNIDSLNLAVAVSIALHETLVDSSTPYDSI